MEQHTVKIASLQNLPLELKYTDSTITKRLPNNRWCVFPSGEWKPLKNQDDLIAFNHERLKDQIYFFKFGTNIYNNFQKDINNNLESLSQSKLIDFSLSAIASIPPIKLSYFRSCDLVITPSYQISTAYHYELQTYLGLHIDTHDNILNDARSTSFWVMALNLGKCERYFHFVNLTFNKILDNIQSKNQSKSNFEVIPMSEIIAKFFECHPNYPIYRLSIPPCYGYAARTQNIIHDGGTNCYGEDDYALLISGKFEIIPH